MYGKIEAWPKSNGRCADPPFQTVPGASIFESRSRPKVIMISLEQYTISTSRDEYETA
jgi:hypothetical protein